MNKIQLFRVFCVLGILIVFCSFTLQAQGKKQFSVILKISPEVVEKPKCVVEIIKNGKEKSIVDVPVNRKYKLALDFFNNYSLNFKYPGHIDKTIIVSTDIPGEVWQNNPYFPPFPMLVTLIKKTADNIKEDNCNSLKGVAYDKKIDNFGKVDVK